MDIGSKLMAHKERSDAVPHSGRAPSYARASDGKAGHTASSEALAKEEGTGQKVFLGLGWF